MTITVSADAGVARMHVAAELDMSTAGDLRQALHRAVARPDPTAIVVDCAQVRFCGSSGIEVLDRAYGKASKPASACDC